jgi:hypothetical protein
LAATLQRLISDPNCRMNRNSPQTGVWLYHQVTEAAPWDTAPR